MPISFDDFTTNMTECALTYRLTLSDNSAYDNSFIDYTSSSKLINIDASDISKIGTYILKITATTTVF
jgi:hypothetical protein